MLAYILGITKRGNKGIANRCKNNHKQGQLKGFQIGAKMLQIVAEITNRGKRNYKPGQGFQTGAEQFYVRLHHF